MNILITDDEPLARERLRHLLNQIEGVQPVEEAASNGLEAVQLTKRYQPDVVLMDIRMPVMDGLEAARHIAGMERPPAIIFCTAYDSHAIEAFDVHATGYLLKPLKAEALHSALSSTRKLNKVQASALHNTVSGNDDGRSYISSKTLKGIELVPLDTVYYFMADSKYVSVIHENGETLIDDPLKELEKEFTASFIRIHRNALVRKNLIERLLRDEHGHYSVQLTHVDKTLPVSRRQVAVLKKVMQSM